MIVMEKIQNDTFAFDVPRLVTDVSWSLYSVELPSDAIFRTS
jgi:hypothetical protein